MLAGRVDSTPAAAREELLHEVASHYTRNGFPVSVAHAKKLLLCLFNGGSFGAWRHGEGLVQCQAGEPRIMLDFQQEALAVRTAILKAFPDFVHKRVL